MDHYNAAAFRPQGASDIADYWSSNSLLANEIDLAVGCFAWIPKQSNVHHPVFWFEVVTVTESYFVLMPTSTIVSSPVSDGATKWAWSTARWYQSSTSTTESTRILCGITSLRTPTLTTEDSQKIATRLSWRWRATGTDNKRKGFLSANAFWQSIVVLKISQRAESHIARNLIVYLYDHSINQEAPNRLQSRIRIRHNKSIWNSTLQLDYDLRSMQVGDHAFVQFQRIGMSLVKDFRAYYFHQPAYRCRLAEDSYYILMILPYHGCDFSAEQAFLMPGTGFELKDLTIKSASTSNTVNIIEALPGQARTNISGEITAPPSTGQENHTSVARLRSNNSNMSKQSPPSSYLRTQFFEGYEDADTQS
ncbi:uncharacterized protein PAC_09426 [Phialocephala subalpina]|uniref:Uncharacterized protein n=1 Tax=Phialocephala subalpina TaxID=576137 RepID=A0A1L7X3C2_9HELO|nr:uncharacterized protein PAC_09426 [Phialocephala subalpina]